MQKLHKCKLFQNLLLLNDNCMDEKAEQYFANKGFVCVGAFKPLESSSILSLHYFAGN